MEDHGDLPDPSVWSSVGGLEVSAQLIQPRSIERLLKEVTEDRKPVLDAPGVAPQVRAGRASSEQAGAPGAGDVRQHSSQCADEFGPDSRCEVSDGIYEILQRIMRKSISSLRGQVQPDASAIGLRGVSLDVTAIHKTLDCLGGGPARGSVKLGKAGDCARKPISPREEPKGGPLGRRQVARIAGVNNRVSELS